MNDMRPTGRAGDDGLLGVPVETRQKEGPEQTIRRLRAPMTKRRLLWLKNWN
ncbi:MAG: hypothetical protein ACOX7A_06685 [Lawsonibacter sp.]